MEDNTCQDRIPINYTDEWQDTVLKCLNCINKLLDQDIQFLESHNTTRAVKNLAEAAVVLGFGTL